MTIFKSIEIKKYRGIKNLKMDGLANVNLVVGDNNCGKTSVLEALQLLRTAGTMANVYKVSKQRDYISFLNGNSLYENFICMFPMDEYEKNIEVSGTCDNKRITFSIKGKEDKVLFDLKDLKNTSIYRVADVIGNETEVDTFDGDLMFSIGDKTKHEKVNLNRYSTVSGMLASMKDDFKIIYISPFEHLRGSIISQVIRNEDYKNICVNALQLFDPGIEDIMIFKSDVGNKPVEYIRHRILGDMPISSYGDGIKKVLVLANAVAQAVNGVLLVDEIETAIHKKYYEDIFKFIVKACDAFNVQAFITTHSIEAIDGLLATQDYELQNNKDNIRVCTIKKTNVGSLSRVMAGRSVYENRKGFDFEVRL